MMLTVLIRDFPHDAYYIHDANYFVHLLQAMMINRAIMLIISYLF